MVPKTMADTRRRRKSQIDRLEWVTKCICVESIEPLFMKEISCLVIHICLILELLTFSKIKMKRRFEDVL